MKASRTELERVRHELKQKQAINDNLKKAIDDLNNKMIDYEKAKSNLTEDKNTVTLVANTNVKNLEKEIESLK